MNLREGETQTVVMYLAGLDEEIAHVIELHPYTTLDDLSSLAYKVELQRSMEKEKLVSHQIEPIISKKTTQKPFKTKLHSTKPSALKTPTK